MRLLRALFVGSLLAVVLSMIGVAPVNAHDQLISSSPADGARLDAAPTQVELQFTADIMTIGALVMVVDGAGTEWVAGDAVIDARTLTVPLAADMPVAGYQVRWRVVSSDGHPISGVIPFTIGDAAPLTTATGETAQQEEENLGVQATEEGGAILRIVLLGVGGAIAALAVLLLITFLRRRTAAAVETDDSLESNDLKGTTSQ